MNSRFLFLGSLAVIALGLASLAHGQQPAANPTQIVLRPAAAPVPSLKYQIVPERRALEQGNAAIFYHRAIELLLQQNSRYQRGNNNDDLFHTDAKLLESWLYGPIASVPRDRVNRLLEASRGSLHEVELGARRQSCDWGLEQREEGVYLLVEEMQQMRALIRLVSLRARLAVIDRRMDDAMHWIQTGFAMARHTSDGPLLIQSLIGAAMSQTMCSGARRPDPGTRRAEPLLGPGPTAASARGLYPQPLQRTIHAGAGDTVPTSARWFGMEHRAGADVLDRAARQAVQAGGRHRRSRTVQLAGVDAPHGHDGHGVASLWPGEASPLRAGPVR